MARKSLLLITALIMAISVFYAITTVNAQTTRKDYLYFMITNNMLVENGQQIGQNFRILIIVRNPCDLKLQITIAGKNFFNYADKVDFIFDRTFTVKENGVLCKINLEITMENVIHKESFTYTIVENPRPLPPEEKGLITIAQLKKITENIRMETMLTTTVFAFIGIAIAVFSKFYLKLLDFTNPFNLMLLLPCMVIIVAFLEYWGIFYAIVLLLSHIIAWYVIKSPYIKEVLICDLKNRGFTNFAIAVYDINNQPYLAKQSFIGTLKRLFGFHIPIITNAGIESKWKLNDTELILANNFEFQILSAKSKNPIIQKILKKFPNLAEKEICYIDLADAHKFAPYQFAIMSNYFEKAMKFANKVVKENIQLKQKIPFQVAKMFDDVNKHFEELEQTLQKYDGEGIENAESREQQ